MLRNRDKERLQEGSRSIRKDNQRSKDRTDSENAQRFPSDLSFSLGGSAVWVGDESVLDIIPKEKGGDVASAVSLIGSSTLAGSSKTRKSIDASSSSSSHTHGGKEQIYRPLNPQAFLDPLLRHGVVKDTHFYHTTVAYKDHQLPIKMPLSTFPEEVGDVCDYFRRVLLLPFINKDSSVFPHHFDQGVFIPPTPHGTCTPPFAHQWTSNTSNYRALQCTPNRETYNFLGS